MNTREGRHSAATGHGGSAHSNDVDRYLPPLSSTLDFDLGDGMTRLPFLADDVDVESDARLCSSFDNGGTYAEGQYAVLVASRIGSASHLEGGLPKLWAQAVCAVIV
jgi:hypothetical protein